MVKKTSISLAPLLDSAAAYLVEQEQTVWVQRWLRAYDDLLDGHPNLLTRLKIEDEESRLTDCHACGSGNGIDGLCLECQAESTR